MRSKYRIIYQGNCLKLYNHLEDLINHFKFIEFRSKTAILEALESTVKQVIWFILIHLF